MTALSQVIEDAVARQDLPFAVAKTASAGGITWSGAVGERSAGQAATQDTVFRIFSMTKAVGSTAAMNLMDRGLLKPDTPVESVLPEFAEIKPLEGFGADGKPKLRAPKVKATARQLATHTSGLTYEYWNTDMPRCMEATGAPTILSGLKGALNYPLLFEPGERWDYGIGIDRLGQMVEKIDGRRIDQFCKDEIFDPLGMPDTRFEVEPHMAPRLAGVKVRGEDGKFADFELAPPSQPEFYGMGHALYSTAPDYMRFPGKRKSHSMAFMRFDEDIPGMRRAGSQAWAGVLNTHYRFDPEAGLAGVLTTQSLLFVEPRFMDADEKFERAAYQHAAR